MTEGLVSIVMPAYNAASCIRQAVASVLAQTYDNWELLIVDDCSTDSTAAIIREMEEADCRIRGFATARNIGCPAEARNLAIKESRGRYLAFLDADDCWLPQKLSDQVACILSQGPAVVFSDYEKRQIISEPQGRIVSGPGKVTYAQLLNGNVILQSSAMIDTQKAGRPFFRVIHHEDFAYWLGILSAGHIAVNTGRVHVLYRVNGSSLSGNKMRAALWTWQVYRQSEKLCMAKACFHFVRYVIYSLAKYMK